MATGAIIWNCSTPLPPAGQALVQPKVQWPPWLTVDWVPRKDCKKRPGFFLLQKYIPILTYIQGQVLALWDLQFIQSWGSSLRWNNTKLGREESIHFKMRKDF